MNKPSPKPNVPNRQNQITELPFFIFLTVILSGISIWTIIDSPQLRTDGRLFPYIGLMVLHIAGYWLSFLLPNKPRIHVIYLFAQGILAFLINLIAANLAMDFGLYGGLIGITVGMLKLSPAGIGMLTYFLGLSLINYGQLSGWQNMSMWAVAILPMSLFVMIYVILYNRQTEARQQAQKLAFDLEKANRQLAEYADQVEDLTLTNERQRMARELHDTLSQGLAGMILKLEAVDANLANNRAEKARAIIQQTMEQARATLADARHVIDDLRQRTNSIDVVEALDQEVERFTLATGITCHFEKNLQMQVPEIFIDVIQKTVAEGLANIARHAQASQVTLFFSCSDEEVKLWIQDDGIGFDLEKAGQSSGHYGLLGMRERARLAGGTLLVDSQPGKGTRITLELPIESQITRVPNRSHE